MTQFYQQGVDTICLTVSNGLCSLGTPYCEFPPTWLAPGKFDFSPLKAQIEEVLEINPDFKIVLSIDLNTPHWWTKAQSLWDEETHYETFNQLGQVASNEKWRADTSEYLKLLLEFTEENYADSIFQYNLLCGGTTEWYDHSKGRESSSRRAAYRRWCLDNNEADPVDIPVQSVREQAGHNMLRDPQEDHEAIRYIKFCNWQVANTILFYAGKARAVVGKRVTIGAYYGYTLLPIKRINHSVMDFDQLLESEDLDVILGIGTYGPERQIGGASGFLQPVDSARANSKHYVHECDQKTHAMNQHIGKYVCANFSANWKSEKEVIAGIKREFCICLLRNVSMWLFDMWGHFYDGENVHNTIGKLSKLWNDHAGDHAQIAEVAMFIDQDSWFYCNPQAPEVYKYSHRVMEILGHIGAPVEFYSFRDIARIDLSRLRYVVLPNLFAVDAAKMKILRERVFCDGRHVLWFDRAGVINDDVYSEDNVEKLTGIPFGESGLVIREMDGWTSLQTSQPIDDTAVIREQIKAAGVHVYVDGDSPVWAAGDYVAVHSGKDQILKIKLKRSTEKVQEVFSGREIEVLGDYFEEKITAPDTRLYKIIT